MNEIKNNKYEIDMIHGPLLGKIILYALPLMASGMLQLAFHAADLIVVGRFTGSGALAAVGSTSSLINLMTNLFIGISAGANVLVARYFGAGRDQDVKEAAHTTIAIAALAGVGLIFVGFFFARPILAMMDTPEDIINDAVLYIRIYFAGMPVIMLYNFGAAILRAVGDTRRPLYYLATAGVINIILNFVFVKYCHMGVAGVGLATVISQTVSTGLLLRALLMAEANYKIYLKEIRIYKDKLLQMLRIGLPAGLQSCLFSFSNVLIQSSVNSFGTSVVAGNTASSNIEALVYTGMNAFYQTALSFTGQNYGIHDYKRIKRVTAICISLVVATGIVLGELAILLKGPLLGIYGTTGDALKYGGIRLSIICSTYFLCGIMDTLVGVLRGMGYAIMPMVVSLSGACLLRIIWILTIFRYAHTLNVLYLSYPVTWFVTAAVHFFCLLAVFHVQRKRGVM